MRTMLRTVYYAVVAGAAVDAFFVAWLISDATADVSQQLTYTIATAAAGLAGLVTFHGVRIAHRLIWRRPAKAVVATGSRYVARPEAAARLATLVAPRPEGDAPSVEAEPELPKRTRVKVPKQRTAEPADWSVPAATDPWNEAPTTTLDDTAAWSLADDERIDERIDGKRIDDERIDGKRVDDERVDGKRIDDERVDDERGDGEQVEDAPADIPPIPGSELMALRRALEELTGDHLPVTITRGVKDRDEPAPLRIKAELAALRVKAERATRHWAVGQPERAIPLFEITIAEAEKLVGQDNLDILTWRADLAAAYELDGRIDEAIEMYEIVLAGRERLLGANHPDTLTVRDGLSVAMMVRANLARVPRA